MCINNSNPNTNNIFFRVDDSTYNQLDKIKNDYKFKSNAELTKTIVKVFCNLYHQHPEVEENTIEEYFKKLEDGEVTFDFVKPKKQQAKRKQITLNNFCELYDNQF